MEEEEARAEQPSTDGKPNHCSLTMKSALENENQNKAKSQCDIMQQKRKLTSKA